MPRTLVTVALAVLAVPLSGPPAAPTEPQLGRDSIKTVIAAMSNQEKVSLVTGTGMRQSGGIPPRPETSAPAVGATDAGIPGAAGTTFPIPRLGIPSIVLADGPAGLRIDPRRPGDDARTFYCTAFPIETLLASSWDVDLIERVGQAVGSEVYEYGIDVLLGPALNIHRNPLGGRNFEYYSEDPLLSGRMAVAMTRGVQSQGVGTSAKHFVANDHEWNRNVINVKVSQRALRELYLRPFEILVREGAPWTVMSSYNKVNGTYTSQSPELLTGVLRDDWGFAGVVMTDWFGGRDPVAQMKAGNDLLMPGTPAQQKTLLAALESRELPADVLDRNVERILTLVQRSPTFKKASRSHAPDLAAHGLVSREAATQGMVLLKNARALPLPAAAKTIALLGNNSYDLITGGTGSGDVHEAYTVSLVEGLKADGIAVEPTIAAAYERYLEREKAKETRPATMFFTPPRPPEMPVAADEVARLARVSDLALVTVGRNAGEGRDRAIAGDFELTAVEKSLITDVAAAFHAKGKKVVVVLNVGGVIETASWRDVPDAILLAWQPGQEAGHAIADVLTGKVAPSGKLATTFPMNYNDVPAAATFPGKTLLGPDPDARPGPFARSDRDAEIAYEDDVFVGYRHYVTKNIKPAFPFGFGLSYTTFTYAALALSDREFRSELTATVRITNTGSTAGREVVQLYLSAPDTSMPKPAIELKAFAKTKTLAPGESQSLTFRLTARDLASFDEASSSWHADAGTYTVRIGASSEDIRQTATFTKSNN